MQLITLFQDGLEGADLNLRGVEQHNSLFMDAFIFENIRRFYVTRSREQGGGSGYYRVAVPGPQ